MSILDLHADELAAASRNTLYTPPKPVERSKWNGWKATTAPVRGVVSGVAESAGFWSDVTGAFGQVLAATDARTSMFGSEIKSDARDKLVTQGVDYSSEAGDIFRNVARSYRPDAQTAHMAETLLYEIPRFAVKAVGYSVAGGPVVGAGLTGADEALQASDELKQQGVDLETRAKVGAVQGVGAALGVVLPVAGKTLAQTAGLVALGGPATFMAQQAITRDILKSADYSKIADQYDPFDPVGLAVSTLIPAGFGAYALRRAAKAPKNAPPQAEVDAALVAHQQEVRDAHSLADPADLGGTAKHEAALAKAEEQMAAGERVSVAKEIVTPVQREANFRAWFDGSRVVTPEGAPMVLYHGTGADIAQFQVSDRGEFGGGIYLTPDTSGASDYATYRGQGPANVLPVYVSIKNPAGAAEASQVASWKGEENARAELIRRGYDGVVDMRSGQVVAFYPEQVKSAIGNSGRFDPTSPSLTDPLPAFAERVTKAAKAAEKEAKASGLVSPKPTKAEVTPAPEATGKPAAKPPAKPVESAKADGDQPVPMPEEVKAQETRLAEIEQELPDLTVMMDGMDSPMKLSDFLASVKKEADLMREDAPDFDVAANCYLTRGA